MWLTLFLLTLVTTGLVVTRWELARRHRAFLVQELHVARPTDQGFLTLADLFWRLGASRYALEVMVRHELLPRRDDADARPLAVRFDEALRAFGGVQGLEETYLRAADEVGVTPERWLLPSLAAAERFLPAPDGLQQPFQHAALPHLSSVDLDPADRFGWWGLVLGSLQGDVLGSVKRWAKERRLQLAKEGLDGALRRLALSVQQPAQVATLEGRLWTAIHAWRHEVGRLEAMAEALDQSDHPCAEAAQLLLEITRARAAHEAGSVHAVAHELLAWGRSPLDAEGAERFSSLLWVNRATLLVGLGADVDAHVEEVARRIEETRTWMNKLREERMKV